MQKRSLHKFLYLSLYSDSKAALKKKELIQSRIKPWAL